MQSWSDWRAQFPVLERRVYLNSCSYGALPRAAAAAIEHYVAERNDKGADWEDWVRANEALRSTLAALFQVTPDELALTTSASAGLNALASALRFDGPRRRVVITDLDFPTSAQIWHAQAARGAEIVRLAAVDGVVPLAAYERAIDDRTLLVTVPQISYLNGARHDVDGLIALAHARGARIVVDEFQAAGTQARGAMQAGADFVVGGTFKYLLGTAGLAYLYVRRELIEALVPTWTGWFAQENPMAMDVTAYRPSPTARRFEAGTPPVVNVYAATAGAQTLQAVGLPAVEARIAELTAAIIARARESGWSLATPAAPAAHGAMIALRSHDAPRLVGELLAEGIVTSSRAGNLRVSPHAYNSSQDLDALFRALHARRPLLV